MSLPLFKPASIPRPTLPESIVLRCTDVCSILQPQHSARLVHADPPWAYKVSPTRGAADAHYSVLSMADIAKHVDQAYDTAAADAYLLLWCTWPKIVEWAQSSSAMRWEALTGGHWHKTNGIGVGHHCRGDSEPWLLYRKGRPRTDRPPRNAWQYPRTRNHSEKPVGALSVALQAWTAPGDLVIDLYAGRAPLARAALATGRRYLGAEVDPGRARAAVDALSAFKSRLPHD